MDVKEPRAIAIESFTSPEMNTVKGDDDDGRCLFPCRFDDDGVYVGYSCDHRFPLHFPFYRSYSVILMPDPFER